MSGSAFFNEMKSGFFGENNIIGKICKSHIGCYVDGGLADGGKREDFFGSICAHTIFPDGLRRAAPDPQNRGGSGGAGFMAVACVVAPGRYRLRTGHAAARPHVSGRDKHRVQQAGVRKAAGQSGGVYHRVLHRLPDQRYFTDLQRFYFLRIFGEYPLPGHRRRNNVSCGVYGQGGVEVLGRLAQLFLPVTIVVFALLSILTIPEWNVSNALPIMGNGPVPSLKGAIVPFTWFSGYLLLGLYFPLLSNQRKAAFFVLTAWFGEMITLAASGLVSVFLFGEYAGTLNYPFIEVVRYIGLGEFFQHIDALLLAVWLPGTFIELAAYFYAAVTGMAEWIGLKDYRALAFPLGFLALVVSFWGLSGAADFANYLATSHVWFDFSLVVFGFILFLTAWIRSKLGALKPNRVPYADQDPAPVAATIVHHEEHAEHAHAESGSASHSHAGAVATSRDLCPSCGSASLINIEGCKTCSNCGHSQCYF